jgi:hypothetical protein
MHRRNIELLQRLTAFMLAGVIIVHPARAAADLLLLDATRYDIRAGRYSVFADFQGNLQRLLDECGKGEPAVVPPGEEPSGKIGQQTRQGIQRALGCDRLRHVPRESAAKDGVITEAIWRAVMGDGRLPSVQDRANALVLSFEATDFGETPEWNFCQDSKNETSHSLDPGAPGFICYNASDPCSYLTWGPRGATAGSGHEIQWILWIAWKRDPMLIERAFGKEFAALRRLFRLKAGEDKATCESNTTVARFMCAIWIDPLRRQTWEDALATLGRSEVVRSAYAQLYSLVEFDGEKLGNFETLWKQLDLVVNEVDYAFFLDRATHLGGPPDDEDATAKAMAHCMRDENRALSVNAAARRCLARLQPHERQAEYRLARDVAYYLDGYPEGALSKREMAAWSGYVPISAERNLGLSDSQPMRISQAASTASLGLDLPQADISELTQEETAACPLSVLSPRRPQRR